MTALTVREPAPPVGLGSVSAAPYAPATFPFAQGDRLLLYTDGVSETRDRDGAFYPLAERVTASANQAPADLVGSITDDLAAYAATPFNDDIALVAIEREKPPPRPLTADRPRPAPRGWAREDRAGASDQCRRHFAQWDLNCGLRERVPINRSPQLCLSDIEYATSRRSVRPPQRHHPQFRALPPAMNHPNSDNRGMGL